MGKTKRLENNIIDLKREFMMRKLLNFEKKIDVEGLAEIDFSDITIFSNGAANDSNDDEIFLGEKATLQVAKAFKEFGFSTLPKTRGELYGTYEFCLLLRSLWGGSRNSLHADIVKRSAIAVIKSSFPNYVKHAELYLNNEIRKLTKLNTRMNLMQKLSREYLIDEACDATDD